MFTRRFHRSLLIGLAIFVGAAVMPLHAAEVKPASKWRIEFDNRTKNDGTIVFRVAPVGLPPIDVETKIPADTGENHAADIVRDSLKASLGEGFHVETDDGEDVLIKRRGKTPKFVVTLVSTSLTGLEVDIEKD